MAELLSEIHEEILMRLDVRDLIRCKSVCKSWQSLISQPHFIKAHLNHSYNKDRDNNEIGDRRIILASLPVCADLCQEKISSAMFFNHPFQFIIGSSNGLVCICYNVSKILLANPSTREVKKLPKSQLSYIRKLNCCGFGYASSIDDYKVVLGFYKSEDRTCFEVLTLKTNVWKLIGEVNYRLISNLNGVLCNGALHWFMDGTSPQNKKKVILSFELANEEFTEIPQPDGQCFQNPHEHCLGTLKECLCIAHRKGLSHKISVMKKYNVKESWEMMENDCEVKYEAIHTLRKVDRDNLHDLSCFHEKWLRRTLKYTHSPIFVQSLVSPHLNETGENNSHWQQEE